MSRDWENTFKSWAQGPSKTEIERAENAERQIKEAIQNSELLKYRNIKVFTQGSYRNRVNVKKESDVDIGVLCYDTMFIESLDENLKMEVKKSFSDADYTYSKFKDELEATLVSRFGRESVTRGNKAFDIKENSYRVEADVAPFFEHRRYTSKTNYLSGVELRPDNSNPLRVINWPEQHYNNAVDKNDKTSRKYKRVVRIIKSLSNEMANNGYMSADKVPGFLIECMVWNVPNSSFEYSTYKSQVRSCLAYLFNNTRNDSECAEWGEVSELKYLFSSSQNWTRKDAHQFISDAWDYVGYE